MVARDRLLRQRRSIDLELAGRPHWMGIAGADQWPDGWHQHELDADPEFYNCQLGDHSDQSDQRQRILSHGLSASISRRLENI